MWPQESVSEYRWKICTRQEAAIHQPKLPGNPEGFSAGDPEQRGDRPWDLEGLPGEKHYKGKCYYRKFQQESLSVVTLEVKLRLAAVTGGLVCCVGQLASLGLSCLSHVERDISNTHTQQQNLKNQIKSVNDVTPGLTYSKVSNVLFTLQKIAYVSFFFPLCDSSLWLLLPAF